MSEDEKRDDFIRGMSSRMSLQQTGRLRDDISTYEAGLIPPIPEPPQTFVIECNKSQAVQDGDVDKTNAWTNTFPPLKLKKGDVVSVNSAFLSTRGSGDLLQFDATNNQTRLLFEYYASNDNANGKKPDYNIKGNTDVVYPPQPYTYDKNKFTNCYPANYRPMRLQRLAETYKTIEDFTPTPAIPEFTLPTNPMPFFSDIKEKYWGYKNSSNFILDGVEDKYIDGMFRPPKVSMRELMTHVSTTDLTTDPTNEPFFGKILDNITIWYITTPMSKYGACSDNATMRIYFAYGTDADYAGAEFATQKKNRDDSMALLKLLRVGEVIQFKQPAWCFGERARKYRHRHTATEAIVEMFGSNVFYCSGYGRLAQGRIYTNDGFEAEQDIFTQVGNPNAQDKYNDMNFRSVMGQFMKIVKVNIGNIGLAQRGGSQQAVMNTFAQYHNQATNQNSTLWQYLPYIEVQCDKGMSLCFNNPNVEHPQGIPTICGPNLLNGNKPQDDLALLNVSQSKTIQLRCWTMGKNQNIERISSDVANQGQNTATTAKTDVGVSKIRLYPKNSQENNSGILNESWYLAFRPYYFSANHTDFEKSIRQCYTMDLVEDKLNIGDVRKADVINALGLTTFNPNILAHNYNYSCLNKDNTTSSIKDGYDIDDDAIYKGGRSPTFWNSSFGYQSIGYTEPICDIKRIGAFNQGEEWWNDSQEANNSNGSGGFYDHNNGYDSSQRLTRNQATLNPNTDLYLKNEKDKKMKFFFTETITATGTEYDGTSNPSWAYSTTPLPARPVPTQDGSMNWIIGIKNMVKAKYIGVSSTGVRIPAVPDNGIFYGHQDQHFPPSLLTQYINPKSNNGNGPDTDVLDLRYPLYQMNTEVYAKFSTQSTSGADPQTEIMLIKIVPTTPQYTSNAGTTPANASAMNAGGTNAEMGRLNIVQGQVGQPYSANVAVAMFIVQRDVEGTGKLTFNGSANPTPTLTDYLPLQVGLGWNSNPRRDTACSFEILNGYGICEHQFEINKTGRDIVPIGKADFTLNQTYDENFGTITGGAPSGISCGGDFYFCQHANMPMTETDGILRMTDNCLRLSDLCLKIGPPTRATDLQTKHTGKLQWVNHMDYIDLSLTGDKVYFSPTDVANLLTKQLHKPANIYKSHVKGGGGGGRFEGGYWKNTAGKYPMNSLFRQIHGPSCETSGNTNDEDWTTGSLSGNFHEGDFCFELDMTEEVINNGINAYGWCGSRLLGYHDGGTIGQLPINADNTAPVGGKHKVWISNNKTYLNVLPTTDSYGIVGYAGGEQPTNGYVRTFMDANDYRLGNLNQNLDYNNDATFGSMFIGSNNAQLNYNTDISRFEWKFLHQPLYSEFSSSSDGSTSGGNVVAKIWAQSIQGYDNWDRVGGVNVINWCCPSIVRGTYSTRRQSLDTDPLTKQDPIGLAFMNKIGFSPTWITDNQGSTDYADVSEYNYTSAYNPKGTTRSDYDISEARPYTQTNVLINETNNEGGGFRTKFGTAPPLTGATAVEKQDYLQNDTTKLSLGGKQVDLTGRVSYNGADPFGIEHSHGTGSGATGNVIIKEIGANIAYGMVNTLKTPNSVIYKKSEIAGLDGGIKIPTNVNMDDVKFPNYQIECDSSALIADELPKKTLIGYFLIMSDIIDKHEFIGSANGGQPLKCIGILSKNYENNDFYFSFQSPVEFHVKQDRTITSIRSVITAPDLSDPAGLDKNSSIIYSIVRQESLPEPDVPPMSVQQALDYETMEQMTSQLGIDMNTFNPMSAVGQMGIGNSGGANLNALRQNLVSAVLNPTPNSASQIASTESMMSSVVSRMPLHERARAIMSAGMGKDALDPSPAQAQMEGLGIAEPNSLEPSPYLSEAQLEIEGQNYMKKGGSDSGMGDSVMDSLRSSVVKDNEFYTLTEPSETGETAPQAFSNIGSKGKLPTASLPEFFKKYMNVANDETRAQYKTEATGYGFSVDNPNVWRLGMLNHWAGKDNKFDTFGDSLYKNIGATLNLEARSKILQAKSRYQSLDPQTAKEERATKLEEIRDRGKDPTKLDIPDPAFGRETLQKRLSRSNTRDPKTSKEQKDLKSVDWTNQNAYDLRTWQRENLRRFSEDLHFGVPDDKKKGDNKLSKVGYSKLQAELAGRVDKSRAKIGYKDNKYSTKEQTSMKTEKWSQGYTHQDRHKTPHPSVVSVKFNIKPKAEAPTQVQEAGGK